MRTRSSRAWTTARTCTSAASRHDARHPRHARGCLQGEGPRLGGQAQGVEDEGPVARRGLLDCRGALPWSLSIEATAAARAGRRVGCALSQISLSIVLSIPFLTKAKK